MMDDDLRRLQSSADFAEQAIRDAIDQDRRKSFDLNGCKSRPRALIMWKNTDASGEFYCRCGAQSGWGGFYCNYVKCTKCGTIYEMPGNLFPKPVVSTESGIEPIDMEPCDR